MAKPKTKVIGATSFGPGGVPVDDFSRYTIYPDGAMINHRGTPMTPLEQSTGYHHFNVVKDDDTKCQVTRHRTMAMMFKPPTHLDIPMDQLEVNHINGHKWDDRLENLEWCTGKENCVHAHANGLCNKDDVVLPRKNVYSDPLFYPYESGKIHHPMGEYQAVSVQLMNSYTGEIYDFRSVTQLADAMGIKRTTLKNRMRSVKPDKVWPDGYQYRRSSDEPWVPRRTEELPMYQCKACAAKVFG